MEIDFDEFLIIQGIDFGRANILGEELIKLILFEFLAPRLIFDLPFLVDINIFDKLRFFILLLLEGIPLFIDNVHNILMILIVLVS